MNTRKTVYEKLFRNDETQLSTHEVELALFDEIKNALKNYGVNNSKIVKANATVTKSVQAINLAMKDANIVVNKQMGKGVLAMAQKFQAQLDKTAKELGVSMAGSDVQKQIIELSNIAEQMQDNIDGVYELLKTVGK